MKAVKYGIRKIGEAMPVSYWTSSNEGGDFCCSEEYKLHHKYYEDENIWSVSSFEQAEYVLHNSTEWYNAGMSTPNHDLDPDLYEVVKVEMIITKVEN
jgi:hypothetical protein